MRFKIISITLVLCAVILSCEKDDSERTWLYIEETHCANEWDNQDFDSTKKKVTEYLKNNGVTIYDFNAEVYSDGPFCEACICPSGRNIHVLIEDKDIITIKGLGFEE